MIAPALPTLEPKPDARVKKAALTAEFKALCEAFLPGLLEDGVIVLVAGPAAGKGTQAKILSEYWGIPTISVGALLRERSEVGDPLGRHLMRTMKKGGLVKNEVVFDLLEKHIEKIGNPKTFILDGCPRSMNQLAPLKSLLKNRGIGNIAALYLKTRLATALSRSGVRREKDIAAGEKPRDDDLPETVRKRYRNFKAETLPVTKEYGKEGQLAQADVDADALSDNLKAVVQALGPVVSRWKVSEMGELRMPDRRKFR